MTACSAPFASIGLYQGKCSIGRELMYFVNSPILRRWTGEKPPSSVGLLHLPYTANLHSLTEISIVKLLWITKHQFVEPTLWKRHRLPNWVTFTCKYSIFSDFLNFNFNISSFVVKFTAIQSLILTQNSQILTLRSQGWGGRLHRGWGCRSHKPSWFPRLPVY